MRTSECQHNPCPIGCIPAEQYSHSLPTSGGVCLVMSGSVRTDNQVAETALTRKLPSIQKSTHSSQTAICTQSAHVMQRQKTYVPCCTAARHEAGALTDFHQHMQMYSVSHDGGPCPVADNINSKQACAYAAARSVELFTVVNSARELDVHPHQSHC